MIKDQIIIAARNESGHSIDTIVARLQNACQGPCRPSVLRDPLKLRLGYLVEYVLNLRRLRPRLVHSLTDKYVVCCFFAILKVPYLLTIWDLTTLRRLNYPVKLVYILFYILIPGYFSVAITVPSMSVLNEVSRAFPLLRGKEFIVLPCFIDDLFFTKAFAKLVESKFKPLSDYVLFIGSTENKNLERSICALSGLNTALVVCSSDKLAEKYHHLAHSKAVYLKSYTDLQISEVISLYDNALLLLYPSLSEGFGKPLAEAASRRLLIVASDLEYAHEITNEHALFCNPYSTESISTTLKRALSLKSYQKKIIVNRSFINTSRKYRSNFIVEKYINIWMSYSGLSC